jgi:hypothetical protein
MTDTNAPDFPNFDTMTTAQFEEFLPDFFTEAGNVKLSTDPRLAIFFAKNPDCIALVRDLETIAETARGLFDTGEEPKDAIWDRIVGSMEAEPGLVPKLETE